MFAGDGFKDAGLCLFSVLLFPEFALSVSACSYGPPFSVYRR